MAEKTADIDRSHFESAILRMEEQEEFLKLVINEQTSENSILQKEIQDLKKYIPKDQLKILDPYSQARLPRVAFMDIKSPKTQLKK